MFKWLADIARALFGGVPDSAAAPASRASEAKTVDAPLPPVIFESVEAVGKTPANASIRPGQLISVVHQDKPIWTMFQCPCGCGEVISLPMQAPHNPRWRLSLSASGRATLSPSVWRNKGCMSHFWIKDGRVFWTRDTGVEPWVARPDRYSKRV